MGAGFIVGGFCPGTSLVAMATGKVDGIFFVLGVLGGIFLFGETVSQFAVFFESSFMGRFTLPELFGVDYGIVVLAVVLIGVRTLSRGECFSISGAIRPTLLVAVPVRGLAAAGDQLGSRQNSRTDRTLPGHHCWRR